MSDEAVLRQLLTGYMHPDFVRREILNVIQQYRALAYRVEAFVFNNGVRKDLLNINGTIPVGYKGNFYNIPVCIWLMDTHPKNAPLCFVKPTPDMTIRVSKYVDNNGKVYMPYLNQWNSSSSSVLALVQCMIAAFAEFMPVYSKPRTAGPLLPRPHQPALPYPQSNPPYPAQPTMPQPEMTYRMPGQPYPGYPQPGTTLPYPAATAESSGTITEEHIKASLLSAVEDKLRRRLWEQAQQGAAELETLRRTQQELQAGSQRLTEVISGLERERTELQRSVSVLQEKEKELERGIERLTDTTGVDVDEAVVTTAPLYSQLLDSFAEEAALEDAVYYVGEALRKEIIDLETFLKQVRTLSRRQFTLRSLMHKCRQKARLAC